MTTTTFCECMSGFKVLIGSTEGQSATEFWRAQLTSLSNQEPEYLTFLQVLEDEAATIAPGTKLLISKQARQSLTPLLILGQGVEHSVLLWCIPANPQDSTPMEVVAQFAHLIESQDFSQQLLSINTASELEQMFSHAIDNSVHFLANNQPELQASGRVFGGLLADLKRKLPTYYSDFTQGISLKVLASTIFLYFACIAPAIAFGALLNQQTNGTVGVMEMIVATGLCGIVYALFSAQPLTILGSTGPIIIFLGILYSICSDLKIPYLPTVSIVGIWTSITLLIMVAFDACVWLRYFTRFTDEIFSALIALIFIYEATHNILDELTSPTTPAATGLLSLVLALTTFTLARTLIKLRHSIYLRRGLREFCSDFGPALAIFFTTVIALCFSEIELEMLKVPTNFSTTSGRAWFVSPLDAPGWVWFAGILPGCLVAILVYLDQNITVRLVNDPKHKLIKGGGYHLDLLVVSLLIGVCSLFGLPWMVAATVRSLNHVRSLANIHLVEDKEQITHVIENRVSAVLIHLLVLFSLLALPMLALIPLPVLFGLFLFMGLSSLQGNQLFERVCLLIADPARFPPTYYLRVIPIGRVHLYTLTQLACLLTLWLIKTTALAILFPLFIAFLVPVRLILTLCFTPLELLLLDAERDPETDNNRLD